MRTGGGDCGGGMGGKGRGGEGRREEGREGGRGGGGEGKEAIRWVVEVEVVARGAVGSWVCSGGRRSVGLRVVVKDSWGRRTEGEVGVVVV